MKKSDLTPEEQALATRLIIEHGVDRVAICERQDCSEFDAVDLTLSQ